MATVKPPRLPGYTLGDRVANEPNLVWWPARDRKGNEVVLRMVSLPESMQESARSRLERWRSITHPNLMRIIDLPVSGDGELALTTERLPGADLAALVRSRGPLAPVQAEALVADISGALEALHAGGIVHADVSPRNLLFTTRGWVLVDGTDPITMTGGTPGFIAPEREAAAAATAAGDVYALAASAAWALASTRASADPDVSQKAVQARRDGQDLDELLAGALDAASSRNPDARPAIREIHMAAKGAAKRRGGNQDVPGARWLQLEPEDLAVGNLRAMALAAPTRMARTGRRRFGSREAAGGRTHGRPTWLSACVLGVLAGLTLTGAGLPEPTSIRAAATSQAASSGQVEQSTQEARTPAHQVAEAQALLRQRDVALASGDQRLLATLTLPGSPARARDQRLRLALGGTRLIGFSSWTRTAMGEGGDLAILVSQREHIRIGPHGVQIVATQPTQCVAPRLVHDHGGHVRIAAMEPC